MYNHHIDTFLSAARLGSFSKAAQELNLTPTAVGKHVDDLERIIGKKLLIRGAQGVKLTEYGACFVNEGSAMKKFSEGVIERTRHSGSGEEKPIRIGNYALAPTAEFNRICSSSSSLARFKTTVVQCDPNRNADDPAFIPPEIEFGLEESAERRVEAEFLPLNTQRLTCLVPTSHRLARKEKLTYEELTGETLVFPSRGNPCITQRFCSYVSQNYPGISILDPPIYYDMEVINRCAEEEKILIGSDRWIDIHPRLVNLPVKWKWEVVFGILWRKDARKEVLAFIKAFKGALKNR